MNLLGEHVLRDQHHVAVKPGCSQAVLRFVNKRPSMRNEIQSLMERRGATTPIMDQLSLIRTWMRLLDDCYDSQQALARDFRQSVAE